MYRRFFTPPLSAPVVRSHNLIGVGLALLLIYAWLPALPVVTAMAILTLGATHATIERFRGSPARMPILLLHATTYAALYGLFITATLHLAASQSAVALNAVAFGDVLLSTLPISIALRHIAAAVRGI